MDIGAQNLLIGGRWTAAENGGIYESLNPFTGQVATRAAAATVDDVDRAVAAAHQAFGGWAALAPSERRRYLMAAAEAVEARLDELCEAVTHEMGGPTAWGKYNVKVLAEKLRYAAGAAYQGLTGEAIPSDNPARTMIAIRKPAGVVASIVPWNAPVLLVGASVPAALVLGNTVAIKASEQTPRTHGLVAACFEDAGFPPGVVNLITNAPEDASGVVEALIAHPLVRRVHFTGSTRVGRIIAEKCAAHLKKVVLELGGKAPCIVLADADLDRAVSAAAFGSFANSGQGCLSTERIIVDKSIAEEFCDRLAAVARKVAYGDPRKSDIVLGPVINDASVKRLKELVDDAVASGARLLAGGTADGRCFAPTVLSGVTPAMRVYQEESFGPLASVVFVDGAEEALRVANDNDYGLSSAIFSRDVTSALDLAKRLDVGMCHINGTTLDDEAQIPFGGVKDSGYGRSGGMIGMEELTEVQWITIEGSKAPRYPIAE
ncbi:salicylaldehyde dehydrogenase [Phyllobacterium phragmitis]|uniref:Salicylaldehyde dehydrogenase n=1 Tax=Phyllobacterium phragmitis TaxID=2670329 RepID=A0A2S9IRP4_9HYPH|nr:aldehyde dehydrogenase [Phyllobacterium phragmitis]PRD43185.1 salicylaldehyde dehydrogenase [Phyllobacterium phragmitis]